MAASGRPRVKGAAGKGEFRYRLHIDPSPVKLAKELGGLGEDFGDWKPVWRELRSDLADGLRKVFDQKGRPLDAGMWPPDDRAYVQRKTRKGFPSSQLIRTGRTIDQVTSPTRGVLSMRKSALVFGAKGPHVRAIQFGFRRRRATRFVADEKAPRGALRMTRARKTAARPFVGWSDWMKERFEERMNDHTRKMLAALSKKLSALGAK